MHSIYGLMWRGGGCVSQQQELQFIQHQSSYAGSQLRHVQECDTKQSYVSTACSALSLVPGTLK